MVDGEIGLGDLLLGECGVYAHFGKVVAMEQSKGARKGWIYKIDCDWFFADQISHWWWKELQVLIKEKYGDNYTFKEKIKITYKGEKCLLDSVTFFENYHAILWNPKTKEFRQAPIYMFKDKTLERIVNQYKKEQIY